VTAFTTSTTTTSNRRRLIDQYYYNYYPHHHRSKTTITIAWTGTSTDVFGTNWRRRKYYKCYDHHPLLSLTNNEQQKEEIEDDEYKNNEGEIKTTTTTTSTTNTTTTTTATTSNFATINTTQQKQLQQQQVIEKSLSIISSLPSNNNNNNNNNNNSKSNPSYTIHHTAIRTKNITVAIKFYELLGFIVETKFRAGPARAAWLVLIDINNNNNNNNNNINQQQSGSSSRIELIEIPSYMGYRTINGLQNENLLGYNHMALDVTNHIPSSTTINNNNVTISCLQDYINCLNTYSMSLYNKTIRIAVQPKQRLIGQSIFEIAFLYDPDHCLIELLYYQSTTQQIIDSGWEPWNGQNFIGTSINDNNINNNTTK
jgi:hypothetical protein